MELMTSKQIAEVLGVTADRVTQISRELGIEATKQFIEGAYRSCYTEEQVQAIRDRYLTGHEENLSDRFPTVSKDAPKLISLLSTIQPESIADDEQSFAQLWQLTMASTDALLKKLTSQKQQLEIELDKAKEWYTIKRMEILNPDRQFNWRQLKGRSPAAVTFR